MNIGVYVCECGINIAATVNVPEVMEFAKTLPNVKIARYNKYMCADPGQELIRKDILENDIDRVVVASCSPRMHEPTYRNVLKDAGISPHLFEMANIREQCSWVHKDKRVGTEKAKQVVAGAIARAALLEPLEYLEVGVTPSVMVIGGGIAGIQAALDTADKGFKTYLVEKDPSIGGKMAQLDKTFPTMDCSACILTPKMVDVARHPNIELMAYSEVEEVSGFIGNFKVKVKKKPKYVHMDICTGCGNCAAACRLKDRIPNEFDTNLSKRSAIYVPFPQAVPLKYTIDPNKCLMLKVGKCGDDSLCVGACEPGAIDFEMKEEIVDLDIGTIIVATGYDLYDPKQAPHWGYGKSPRVITGLEFERLVSASGPTLGHLEIDGKEPKNVAFVHCVGSRDREGNEYCSRVCCMYTAKHAHMVIDKLPNSRVVVYNTDVRAFGKGFEEFYNRVREEGVDYVHRELDDDFEVIPGEEGVTVKAAGHPDFEADLVVLANAIEPRFDANTLRHDLKISCSPDTFYMEAHPKLRPIDTFTEGIFLAGCCQGPKDIPDTVAQASGAAVRACIPLAQGVVRVEPIFADVDADVCAGCRLCEALCPYNAPEFNAEDKVMEIQQVLCKGCGTCGAACPSGAITMNHYKDSQVIAQLGGILAAGGA